MELNKLEQLVTDMGNKINALSEYMLIRQTLDKIQEYKYIDLLPKYLSYKQIDTKECSQYDKISLFNKFITPYFKSFNISQITKITLSDWQANLWQLRSKNGKRFSYNYLTKIRGYLFAFLSWCECMYNVPNVMTAIKIPKNIQAVKSIGFWELADFKAFIPFVKDTLYSTLFTLLFYGGFRIGEVMALTNCDFDGQHLSITKTLSRKTLDGEIYKITPTKNYKNRVTPLPQIAANKLNAYVDWKKTNNVSNSFLFGGNKPLAETSLRRAFKSYLNKSGAKTITIHGLRHSYVSLLVHLGTSTKKIAELIGDTEEQVIKTYSHLYSNDTLAAVNRIDSLI